MKVLFTLLPLLFLAICCSAQTVPVTAAGPGLTVIKNQWHRDFHNPALDKDVNDEVRESQTGDRQRRDIEQANDIRRAQGMPTVELPQPKMKDVPPNNITVSYVY